MLRRKLRKTVSLSLYTLCAYLDGKARAQIDEAERDLEDTQKRAALTHMMTAMIRERLDRDSAPSERPAANVEAVH